MKNIVHYNKLFDAYKNVLKEEEAKIFCEYYEEDLTMQEIAENYNISKSAVGKKINNIENKLDKLEESLNIVKNNEILESLLECDDIDMIKEKISIIVE